VRLLLSSERMRAPDEVTRTPVAEGEPLASWTAAEVLESRGDVVIVRAHGDIPARVAVFRYRGAEPLPRFLEHLKSDGDRWRTLRHPNLMPTLETGRLPSQITCYWAQEEVPGTSLADRLAVHPLIAPDHALAIVRQVGTALGVVHRAELVHGDIGPHNVILVDARDRPRLAWGGLAIRLESAGMDAGRTGPRLAETAPEMLGGKPGGPASDVFSLCALLYRMLAGQPAWSVRRGGPPPGVTANEPLPSLPEWVPADIARMLSDGLQRDPSRRPDLFELVDRIEDHESALRGLPVPLGTWSPAGSAPLPDAAATPPTVSRTVAPHAGMDGEALDPTLANTPPSVSRLPDGLPQPPPAFTSGSAGSRSVAPTPPSHVDRSLGSRGGVRPKPAPAPTSPLLVPAAILASAVVLGVFLFAGMWWVGPRAAPPAPAPVAPVAPTPEPAPIAGTVAPPPRVGPGILTLVTDPTSAEVWEDGRFLGLTPSEVVLDPAGGTRERVFELRLGGFVTHTVRQPFSEVDVRHSVALQPVPRPAPAADATAPKPASKTGKPKGGIKVER
jgi:serine/threonine protein kinase